MKHLLCLAAEMKLSLPSLLPLLPLPPRHPRHPLRVVTRCNSCVLNLVEGRQVKRCPKLNAPAIRVGRCIVKLFRDENGQLFWSRGEITQFRSGRKKSNAEVAWEDEEEGERRNHLLLQKEYFSTKQWQNAVVGSWFFLQ